MHVRLLAVTARAMRSAARNPSAGCPVCVCLFSPFCISHHGSSTLAPSTRQHRYHSGLDSSKGPISPLNNVISHRLKNQRTPPLFLRIGWLVGFFKTPARWATVLRHKALQERPERHTHTLTTAAHAHTSVRGRHRRSRAPRMRRTLRPGCPETMAHGLCVVSVQGLCGEDWWYRSG